jgi:hypothetical protein
MTQIVRLHWLGLLGATAFVGAGAWVGQTRLRGWSEARVAQQYRRDIAILPARQAAALVRQLVATDGGEWLEVVVAAATDSRPVVAAAGKESLLDLIQRWEQAPSGDSSSQAGSLARVLARQAPGFTAEQLPLAQSICSRLLLLPVDEKNADVAGLIGHCEAVLRIPLRPPPALRSAADSSAEAAPRPPSAPLEAPPIAASESATAPPTQPASPVEVSEVPHVGDATREPRRLISPRAIRITDEPEPMHPQTKTLR